MLELTQYWSMASGEAKGMRLEQVCDGVFKAPGARIVDRSGRKRLPIGWDGFVPAMRSGVLIDKTMLIADVLDSGYAATLFCRPRRFGKTLNMTMLKAFFEAPEAGGLPRGEAEALFGGTEVWEADGGAYRQYQGAYPVVHLSFNSVKKATWADSLAEVRRLVAREYLNHRYLRESGTPLAPEDVAYFNAIAGRTASDQDLAASLAELCRMLREYHGTSVVVLIDEYDAPVMTGYTRGYYDEVVDFLKGWLTGALKDGGAALAFACLTGVQRITKESVFSDLNNLYVSTPIEDDFDERYGFTDAEVEAMATYFGYPDCMPEAREWYDGYRFGRNDVYNPWSTICYLNKGCTPGLYWANTSGNAVVSDLLAHAEPQTLEDVYSLLKPGGTVLTGLDLGVVFPELSVRGSSVWSMLYLAGYLTTDDVAEPDSRRKLRQLRVPNREVTELFVDEIVERSSWQAGGSNELYELQRAFVSGDAETFRARLSSDALRASYMDLTSELPCEMFLMGLLFGAPGYEPPTSNREEGLGRYDIRMEPDPKAGGRRPLITVEVKFLRSEDRPTEGEATTARLDALAKEGVAQIVQQGYDTELPRGAEGRLRWGVAFGGKRVSVACERA